MERLVRENIDFKRGTSSKEALGLGKLAEFRKFIESYVDSEKLIDYYEKGESGTSVFNIFITGIEGNKVKIYYENPNPFKNSDDYWIDDSLLLTDIEEIDEWHPTIFMKNPLPSSIDESIDFKRGQSSKEALNIGKAKNDKLITKLAKDKDDIRLFNYWKNWNPGSAIWADLRHSDPWTISFYTDDLADEHSYDNKIKQRFHKTNIDRIEDDHGIYNVYLIKPEA
jgi:hypothetical protein